MLQKCIFCFAFLKLSKLEMLFQKQDFYIWMKKEKTGMATSNNPNGDRHKKNYSETRRSMVETRRFYIQLFTPICTRIISSQPAQLLFCWNFTIIAAMHTGVYFFCNCFSFFNTEIKAANFMKHKRETSLLHTLSLKCMKSFDFIILLHTRQKKIA